MGLANASIESASCRLDYMHMPGPGNRCDDTYFEPLDDFRLERTWLYPGLLHTHREIGHVLANSGEC